MKTLEKAKAQKILDKIQSGNFDENDVDNFFMRLRAYSNGFIVFREIADFVAHNDVRNKGLTNTSLQSMYYSVKYFNEYVSPNKNLDIGKPFPIWVKTLFKYQIDKIAQEDLKNKFNVSPDRLKARIDNCFKDDSKSKLTTLKEGKLSQSSLEAINYVMSFIIPRQAFSQDDLFRDTLSVISHNKLNFDNEALNENYERIILCVLLLLHNSQFDCGTIKPAYCHITSEKLSISHNTRFVDKDGNEVEITESFGTLQVNGHVVLDNNGKELTIGFPVLSTTLAAEIWCDPASFVIEPLSPEAPRYLCKRLKLDGDLLLNERFQLQRFDA